MNYDDNQNHREEENPLDLGDLNFFRDSSQKEKPASPFFDSVQEDLGTQGEQPPEWEDPWIREVLSESEPGASFLGNDSGEDGGAYDPDQPHRRQRFPGGPWTRKKILVTVLIAVAVVVIIGLSAAAIFWKSMLGQIRRPEYTENSLTPEEIQYWATYNPDAEAGITGIGMVEEPEEEVTTAPTLPPVKGDYITNILIIGQDYRKGEATKLADSILLCSFNRKNATLTLTSFLRDTYIQMPNFKGHTCGRNRINVVYNLGWQWGGDLGGMEMMDKCLKENFGIEVDYNAEVNFETFSQVINKLGGVDVELNEAEVNYLKRDRTGFNDYVEVGMNHLDGYTALCYARARKLDGDVQRTGRQRKVVSSILDRVRDMSVKEIKDLVWEVLPLVLTDMTDKEITDFIKDIVPYLPKLKVEAGMCPAKGTYWGKMIDIAGIPSSVIGIYLKPNQQLLQWICEVPAFEASPDGPPEIETLPPPKPTEETEPTEVEEEEETKAPPATTKPPETTDSNETEPGKPGPNKPDPNKPDPNKPDPNKPDPNKPDPDKPDPDKPGPNKPDPNKPGPNKPDPNQPGGGESGGEGGSGEGGSNGGGGSGEGGSNGGGGSGEGGSNGGGGSDEGGSNGGGGSDEGGSNGGGSDEGGNSDEGGEADDSAA